MHVEIRLPSRSRCVGGQAFGQTPPPAPLATGVGQNVAGGRVWPGQRVFAQAREAIGLAPERDGACCFADPQTGRVPTDNAHRPEAAQAAAALSTKTLAVSILPLTGHLYGCPIGLSVQWSCFYRNARYGGRMGVVKSFGPTVFMNFGPST